IGAALAEYYAGKGAVLGLYARRPVPPASLAAKLGPRRHAWYAGDVREAAALRAAAEDFVARFGQPDIVIANAGISVGTSTQHAADLACVRAVRDTNMLCSVH